MLQLLSNISSCQNSWQIKIKRSTATTMKTLNATKYWSSWRSSIREKNFNCRCDLHTTPSAIIVSGHLVYLRTLDARTRSMSMPHVCGLMEFGNLNCAGNSHAESLWMKEQRRMTGNRWKRNVTSPKDNSSLVHHLRKFKIPTDNFCRDEMMDILKQQIAHQNTRSFFLKKKRKDGRFVAMREPNRVTRPTLDRRTTVSIQQEWRKDLSPSLSTQNKQLRVRKPEDPSSPLSTWWENAHKMHTCRNKWRGNTNKLRPHSRLRRRNRPAQSPNPASSCRRKKNSFLPPSQTDNAKIRLCKCFVHSSCWATFPVGELLLVGPMVVVLTSTLGSAHFPEHLRPAPPASTADVDLSVNFYTYVAICPRRLLDAQINGLTNCMPKLLPRNVANHYPSHWSFRWKPPACPPLLLGTSIRESPLGRVHRIYELWPDHLEYLFVPLHIKIHPPDACTHQWTSSAHSCCWACSAPACSRKIASHQVVSTSTCKLFCTLAGRRQETPSPHWHPCRLED